MNTFIEGKKSQSTIANLYLLVIGIIFLSANMRAPITSVGPVAASIRDHLSLSNAMTGALTTIPLLAFALISPFAPRLARSFGMETVLFFVLIVLTFGSLIRPLGHLTVLYGGTIFIGAAIAITNVLMPAFVKMNFANHIGLMTGIYSVAMNLTGAIATAISIPVAMASGLGWKGSIGIWSIVAVIALVAWIPQLQKKNNSSSDSQTAKKAHLWRSPLAWQVTLFMGLQSLLFYSLVAWLPIILQDQGMTASHSGFMLALVQFTQIPFMFIIPIIAGKMKNQVPLIWITFLFMVAGLCGILFGGNLLILPSVISLGIAGAFAFALAMMFFTLKTVDAHQAADLSAMAQSFGYLLAATTPPLFGLLFDLTASWTVPLFLLIGAACLLLVIGLQAARDRTV
ncbi:MFS transporter [Sporosarcina sp. HYO08]|uniref:CynX/NimT family MFS transporter n=1 Tax=Sporosarcina sp. HYO08 TaxID=1759557 RepID=UPI0012E35066|nr:MFS transporter [Sporosarcina sp. HYO08]